ncbi:putative DNA polymerase III subunit delta [Candidatus Hydrogenisulfobacillus filiaventi]|uniref:DNA-directed DNA polymerase n=1 Tax=Candidatus Hydrogenisulfobacillus filiaventi TaxID=2707344 RepID=A0A6F8ZJK8_9FIRM|nr:putative DNA polymerase III subunit delta [Candidatus Hydrogenisulfobacillus filiaventi]
MDGAWERAWNLLPEGDPRPVYVLMPAGRRDADPRLDFWAERWLDGLLDRLSARPAVRRFTGAEAAGEVWDWLGNGGLFESARLAVWRDPAGRDLPRRLAAFAGRMPPGAVLVVRLEAPAPWIATLPPAVVVVSLALPAEAAFSRLLEEEARTRGLKLDAAARARLLAAVRGDGFQLRQELDKLALWCAAGRRTDAEAVARLAADPANPVELYRFLDAFQARQGEEAWRWLEELLAAGQPPLVLLITAVRQLLLLRQGLLAAARRQSPARAWAAAGVSGGRARRLEAALSRWRLPEVEAALERAATADAALKRGGEARVWLESWVALALPPRKQEAPPLGGAG